jgi:hypothetical protein
VAVVEKEDGETWRKRVVGGGSGGGDVEVEVEVGGRRWWVEVREECLSLLHEQ